MILIFIQAVLVIGAGVGLFRLWRLATPSEPWLRYVVAAGFLGRAVLGQALFWISWARLPVARSMQLGDGLWFFARDALLYVPFAFNGARHGLWAIITFDHTAPSVTYIQTLSLTTWLFGLVTSAGLLLNLLCFLGMIALLVHWPVRTEAARKAAAVMIAAISLTPAFVLWSMQPLKDTFFQFLVVAFVASCAWWQRAWSVPGRAGARFGIGALLSFLMYMLAGIRWYFAFALIIAASLFLFLTAFRTAGRRSVAFSAAIVLTIVFCRVLVAAAKPYMPPQIIAAMTPSTALGTIGKLPVVLLGGVDSARDGFQRAGGKTAIVVPATPVAVASVKPLPKAPAPLPVVPRPVAETAARPQHEVVQPAVPPVVQPQSRASRLFAGVSATVLPRTIGESLGLFHIGGGRSMLWFTELDTLVFDVILLLAIAAVVIRFRTSLRNPLTWFVLVLTVLVGAPLVYTVTNYGTLFRLREMIYLGLLFTPLAVVTAAPDRARVDDATEAA
ncbi:MAG: hypothetical protein QOE68_1080 [Thermoanaerobaculia bacterium]|jgi:hypothetical protein|nr:hypothetical protein [Thermoanaerobaculia bacterium]